MEFCTKQAEGDAIGASCSVHAHINFVTHQVGNFTVETPRITAGELG